MTALATPQPPAHRDDLQLQLQHQLLDIQESLDTLVTLLRHSTMRAANPLGLAAILAAMSDKVADVSIDLAG